MSLHIGEITSDVVTVPADPPAPPEPEAPWDDRARIQAIQAQLAIERERVAAEDVDD